MTDFVGVGDKLMWAVSDTLSKSFLDLDVETGVENGRLMAYLAAHGEVCCRKKFPLPAMPQ